jgi:hypothetical protein
MPIEYYDNNIVGMLNLIKVRMDNIRIADHKKCFLQAGGLWLA